MIKKLRKKFILIAMLSVTVVLGAIITVINVANYIKIDRDSDAVLSVLAQNGGGFPFHMAGGRHDLSPETPYETRFFTVTVFDGGDMLVDTGSIAAVGRSEAEEIARKLIGKNKSSGMYGDYKYIAVDVAFGTMYIFLDCSRSLGNFRSFLLYSTLISLGVLVLVLALVLVLSRFALLPIEESYIKQKSFITNASHDIKTPLTVIGADAEVIELENGESDWTRDIKKQVERLTSLTDKLVFLSRLEESDNKLDLAPFKLSEMIEETCLSYETTAAVRGLELSLDILPGVEIVGNEDALRRSVALMMDNAVKYALSYVKVSLSRCGGSVVLKLSNDADGLKQGSLDELFDRFYRADPSRNSSTGGHGIGLSVVKSVVAAHKGKISAQSPDGRSVEFTVVL